MLAQGIGPIWDALPCADAGYRRGTMKSRTMGTASRAAESSIWNTMLEPLRNPSCAAREVVLPHAAEPLVVECRRPCTVGCETLPPVPKRVVVVQPQYLHVRDPKARRSVAANTSDKAGT